MEPGYSPYAARLPSCQAGKRMSAFSLPVLNGRPKKWLMIFIGALAVLFILFYWWLGPLRFFLNHYLGLTFFSKNYIVLFQNNYELRPGGGFITAYGNLDTLLGFPKDMSFHNSYEIDTSAYVTPPYPQEEMLKNEWYQGYSFRDANWEPDFPQSANTIIDFYQKKFPGKDVDGIVVVNFSLIEKLADVFGGIKLNGKTLTSNNLFSEMEFAVNNIDRHSEPDLAARKNILADLAASLLSKMKWHPGKTKKIFAQAIKSKDLYFWFKSARLQNRIEKLGWANHLTASEDNDFLAINLANLGAKKADRYMQREAHYYLNLTKEVPEVNLEISLRFPGFTNIHSDNYKGYLRVFLPQAATIRESPVDSDTARQDAFTAIGTKVIIPAGSKTTLSYNYTLPRTTLKNDEYSLRLVRQSGNDMNYSITTETPNGTAIESPDFATRENRGNWNGNLDSDRVFSFKFSPDTVPPYPVEQIFEDLNTLKIYWSEPIDQGTGSDALNYVIWDSNYVNKETDQAKVVYAEVQDGSISKLELEGVVRQPLERYKMELKGIRDSAGNLIVPDPKSITIVQRYKEKELISND